MNCAVGHPQGSVSEKVMEDPRNPHKQPAREDEVVVPYIEPVWSTAPPPNYKFEVLKGGSIISDITLNSPYIVFGRLQTCDVVLEHPSISRYHAILQYCPGDSTRHKGFYIYDLGSTHGTFLNKKQISAKIYYKLEAGHILKFGASSRLHIFQGSEESVNEEAQQKDEEICDWGLGEDAEEEEDLAVNPFALSTDNELYLEDPKKTLRGWFEREGYELEYDVEEKGFRTFVCRVQLPIDTATGEYPFAEASVTGKKKEAVVACAMEACRILDRHGVLRQARHENRRKKRKNWENEDFYDSDEDTYLDRTGTIEKKREIRKKMVKKTEAETFQSLTSKLESVNVEISEIEGKIQNWESALKFQSDDEEDTLESYMSHIGSSVTIDKVTKSKLRLKLSELLKEKSRLEKLLDVARPTALPPVSKTFGIIGKRPTKKFQLPTVASTYLVKKCSTDEVEEEEDSDSELDSPTSQTQPQEHLKNEESLSQCENKTPDKHRVKNAEELGTTVSQNLAHQPVTSNLPQKIKEAGQKTINAVKKASKTNKVDVYNTNVGDYSMWVPPDNQTGDGTTHLNAKYGY